MDTFDFTNIIKATDKGIDAKSVLLRVFDELMKQSTPEQQLTLARIRAKIEIEVQF